MGTGAKLGHVYRVAVQSMSMWVRVSRLCVQGSHKSNVASAKEEYYTNIEGNSISVQKRERVS